MLRLPDLEHAKSAVLSSLRNADAQRGYSHAIDEFVDWYCSEPRLAFNRLVVLRYRSHLEARRLAPGTINLRLGAVRRLAYEAADGGLLSADLAAGIELFQSRTGYGRSSNAGSLRPRSVRDAYSGEWTDPDRSGVDHISEKAIWHIVRKSARRAGLSNIAPHDLRRTCARLCQSAGGELEQIQFLLGHVSIQTTERYLGSKQRLRFAVNDRIGIEPDM